jgi:hypothetical protein
VKTQSLYINQHHHYQQQQQQQQLSKDIFEIPIKRLDYDNIIYSESSTFFNDFPDARVAYRLASTERV